MKQIKKMISPFYELYRHRVDTKRSAKLYNISKLMDVMTPLKESGKTKVRFSHYSESTWNAIESVVNAFAEDTACDVLVILARNEEGMRRQVIKSGVPYVLYEDYRLEEDQPDVLVLSHTRDNTFKNADRKYIKLLVVLSIALVHYYDDLKKYISETDQSYGALNPDYHLYDRSMYDELSIENVYGKKLICMGNPKYDGIYKAANSDKTIPTWKKLSGKKVVLYAPDHGVQYGYIAPDFSFDVYAENIFRYFAVNKDMGLIFRPHPSFLEEMFKHGYWTHEDVDRLKNMFIRSENMIWDENDTYDAAFSVCDAILTDCRCGIICSALPTLKPIGILYKKTGLTPINERLTACQYEIYSSEELTVFLDGVRKGSDDKLELRKKTSSESVCHFDGMNGRRIKDFILEKVYS